MSSKLKTNKNIWSAASRVLIGVLMLGSASALYAQSPSHAYINNMRSSYNTHYFVSVGVAGLAGTLTNRSVLEDGKEEFITRAWQGYGIRNEIGIEFLKFLHFSVAHNSLNLRSKKDSTENLSGSRFEGTGSLNFYAPLGNLQLGGGFLGSRVDLRRQNMSSDYYGSGYFYNVGYNYFMSSTVSFYIDGRRSTENLMRNSGEELPRKIQVDATEAGLGFKIWL